MSIPVSINIYIYTHVHVYIYICIHMYLCILEAVGFGQKRLVSAGSPFKPSPGFGLGFRSAARSSRLIQVPRGPKAHTYVGSPKKGTVIIIAGTSERGP